MFWIIWAGIQILFHQDMCIFCLLLVIRRLVEMNEAQVEPDVNCALATLIVVRYLINMPLANVGQEASTTFSHWSP